MQMPKVRVDILLYYCIIVFLITISWNMKLNLKMLQDEGSLIKNSLNNSIVIDKDSKKWEEEWDRTNSDIKEKQ
jgi:hypothetical protein